MNTYHILTLLTLKDQVRRWYCSGSLLCQQFICFDIQPATDSKFRMFSWDFSVVVATQNQGRKHKSERYSTEVAKLQIPMHYITYTRRPQKEQIFQLQVRYISKDIWRRIVLQSLSNWRTIMLCTLKKTFLVKLLFHLMGAKIYLW